MPAWLAKRVEKYFGCFRSCTIRHPTTNAHLNRMLDTIHLKTIVYHPAANRMVERMHRQLKAAIMSQQNVRWMEALSTVLLSIRSTWREDLQGTVTEILYGQSLRLPGEFLGSHRSNDSTNNHVEFVRQLYQHIRNLRPISDASRHNKGNIFVFKDLAPSEQVLYDTRWSQAATSTAMRRAEQSRKAIGENVRRQHKRSRSVAARGLSVR